jgi:hypothetical protein
MKSERKLESGDMDESGPPTLMNRLSSAIKLGVKGGLKTTWFLVKVIVPVTLAVAILGWCGALAVIARFCAPVMGFIGLPGDASLVFISSIFLNIYSAIAVAGSIGLDMRQFTIIAIMCLTAHNLIVETAVMKKTGSSATKMVVIRIVAAILAAKVFSLVLPAGLASLPFSSPSPGAKQDFLAMLAGWGLSTLKLVAKIFVIVMSIMVVQRLLEELKVMDFLSKLFSPVMKFFGLPANSSFLWIVINIVGYAYGAGIVTEQIESGKMKPQEGDLFNHHAGMCHSLLEDTTLFAVLGVSLFWITVPRLVMATALVWLERLRRHYVRRSFRAAIG